MHETHRTRFSDSSLYDEVCELCGATDMRGSDKLYKPCPSSQAKRDEYDQKKKDGKSQ